MEVIADKEASLSIYRCYVQSYWKVYNIAKGEIWNIKGSPPQYFQEPHRLSYAPILELGRPYSKFQPDEKFLVQAQGAYNTAVNTLSHPLLISIYT